MVGYQSGNQFMLGYFILLLGVIIVLIVSTAIYLLFALGLYKMAKNLGLRSPWMAFVPVLSGYLLGLVAEQDSMGKKVLKYSWILLIFQAVTSFFSIAYYFILIASRIFGSIGLLVIFLLVYVTLNITTNVFYYIALYRVYKLFDPDNAPIFIILSIFFSISIPILMFILRNRMPMIACTNTFDQINYQE